MLGNGRLDALCFDGAKRLCHIRGKLRKKVCNKLNYASWSFVFKLRAQLVYIYQLSFKILKSMNVLNGFSRQMFKFQVSNFSVEIHFFVLSSYQHFFCNRFGRLFCTS